MAQACIAEESRRRTAEWELNNAFRQQQQEDDRRRTAEKRAEDAAREEARKLAERREAEEARAALAAQQLQRRQQEAALAASEKQKEDAIEADPKLMRFVYGANLCTYANRRASNINEIAEERRYAKFGGVRNMAKLYRLQKGIRRADESAAQERSDMRRHKGTAAPCSNPTVKKLIACKEAGATCAEDIERMSRFVEAFDDDDEE